MNMAGNDGPGGHGSARLASSGMIVRQKEPKNLEMPFDRGDSFLTPSALFFLARARDSDGRVQPDRHDPNYGSDVINHPLSIEVYVEDRSP
jgi:hypothetical protein